MAGDVYTVTSGKGGVGKTTTAVNLAVAIRQRGHSAAVLDADLGMPNVATILDVDPGTTVHDVLAGEADVEAAVVEPAEGLGIVAGDPTLEGFAHADPDGLQAVVDGLADRYDHVVVDTGGGLSFEGVLPLELGDEVILVTNPEEPSIVDTEKSAQLADRLGVPVRGVVVTHTTESVDAAGIADRLGVDLLGTVPLDATLAETADIGKPIATYAPDSDAGAAYNRLAGTLVGEASGPLGPLVEPGKAEVESDGSAPTPASTSESAETGDEPTASADGDADARAEPGAAEDTPTGGDADAEPEGAASAGTAGGEFGDPRTVDVNADADGDGDGDVDAESQEADDTSADASGEGAEADDERSGILSRFVGLFRR